MHRYERAPLWFISPFVCPVFIARAFDSARTESGRQLSARAERGASHVRCYPLLFQPARVFAFGSSVLAPVRIVFAGLVLLGFGLAGVRRVLHVTPRCAPLSAA